MGLSTRELPSPDHLVPNLADSSYSFSQMDYSLRCMFPKWSDWDIKYTQQGLAKERIRQVLSLTAFTAGIVGLYQIWKGAVNVGSLLSLLQQRLATPISRNLK